MEQSYRLATDKTREEIQQNKDGKKILNKATERICTKQAQPSTYKTLTQRYSYMQ
ncbi:hypothetical protein LA52FAK_24400 [Desulforhopalus sp. 52FAK]